MQYTRKCSSNIIPWIFEFDASTNAVASNHVKVILLHAQVLATGSLTNGNATCVFMDFHQNFRGSEAIFPPYTASRIPELFSCWNIWFDSYTCCAPIPNIVLYVNSCVRRNMQAGIYIYIYIHIRVHYTSERSSKSPISRRFHRRRLSLVPFHDAPTKRTDTTSFVVS